MNLGPFHVALVTAFPPSNQRLNEYGFHLAQELTSRGIRVSVLADNCAVRKPELAGFEVHRCWDFDSLRAPVQLLRRIRTLGPDVVWFNLVYSTFGDHPLAAFAGLCTPWMCRIVGGAQSHVILHHLMENVDLADADVAYPRLYRMGGSVATRALLRASSVAVLLEAYKTQLERVYGARNVRVRRHGILCQQAVPPDFELRRNAGPKIVAFGKWGRYKRLELMLAAFEKIRRAVDGARLLIAGPNHPNRPGYVQMLAAQHKHDPHIRFHGYVREEEMAAVFADATLVALPYSSSGGPSGVAHQACQFGLPIVAADIPDIMNLAAEEGIAAEYYRNGSAESLAARVIDLLRNPRRQRQMAEQNYRAGCEMTISSVVQQYLEDFSGAPAQPGRANGRYRGSVVALPREEPRMAEAETGKGTSISVVVPAYNEESRLLATLRCIRAYLAGRQGKSEVIVVSDGSTDGTVALAERFAEEHRDLPVRVIRFDKNQGKGAAVKRGVLAAVGEWVAICDADLRHGFTEITRLENAVGSGADMAIASRWHLEHRKRHVQPMHRRISGMIFNAATRYLLGLPFRDTQCGLKLLKRSAAVPLLSAQRIRRWAFDCELLLLSARNGLRVAEVPVEFEHDYNNSHFRPLRDSLRTARELLQIVRNQRRGAYAVPTAVPRSVDAKAPFVQEDAA